MTTRATGSFSVKSWQEKPYDESEAQARLLRAEVVYAYQGDLEGEGQIEYLMCYSGDGIAYFTGYEHVRARLGSRSGTFVLHHHGIFNAGAVNDAITIVPGTATGELSGLTGSGTCGGDGEAVVSLDYELA